MKITPIGIWGGYPKANGATSSFLIEHDGFSCLIDCGSGVLASLQNYLPLEELDAVVISHYHADHIADIGSLQYSRLIHYYLGNSLPALPIYGHRCDEESFNKLAYEGRTIGVEISEEDVIQIGPFTVSFCETIHPVYCLAMNFSVDGRSIVLTADTEWKEKLVDFAREADILISEANLYEIEWNEIFIIGAATSISPIYNYFKNRTKNAKLLTWLICSYRFYILLGIRLCRFDN